MKYEWRKQDKALYGAKTTPALLTVPAQNYIRISGRGDPNGADFSNRVGALYALAYAVKACYKAAPAQPGIDDFAVCPLEGTWARLEGECLEKEKLTYTLMIRQPDFVRGKMVQAALERVRRKKPNPLYAEIQFDRMPGGPCVTILHIGAYDDEPASFAKMDQFAAAHSLRRTGAYHREIYLSSANRVEPSKRKTILRYPVAPVSPGGV